MLEIAVEAESALGTLLDRARAGEEVLFTQDGKRVARLTPTVDPVQRAAAAAALDRMTQAAKKAKVRFDWEELKKDRDAGRP